MINNDRIVPIQKIDLLSLIGTVLNLTETEYDILPATDVEGDFIVDASGDAGNLLANQPIKSLNFADGVTAGTVYFVAAFDYVGITIDGTAITPTGTVKPDGVTLYKAVLAEGDVTITAVTPILSE